MVSRGSASHSHPCGAQWQHSLQVQSRLPVAARITDHSMAFTRNSDLSPGCSRVSWQQHRPGHHRGSTGHSDQFAPSLLEATQPTEVGSGCSTDHGGLHGPQWYHATDMMLALSRAWSGHRQGTGSCRPVGSVRLLTLLLSLHSG